MICPDEVAFFETYKLPYKNTSLGRHNGQLTNNYNIISLNESL